MCKVCRNIKLVSRKSFFSAEDLRWKMTQRATDCATGRWLEIDICFSKFFCDFLILLFKLNFELSSPSSHQLDLRGALEHRLEHQGGHLLDKETFVQNVFINRMIPLSVAWRTQYGFSWYFELNWHRLYHLFFSWKYWEYSGYWYFCKMLRFINAYLL